MEAGRRHGHGPLPRPVARIRRSTDGAVAKEWRMGHVLCCQAGEQVEGMTWIMLARALMAQLRRLLLGEARGPAQSPSPA